MITLILVIPIIGSIILLFQSQYSEKIDLIKNIKIDQNLMFSADNKNNYNKGVISTLYSNIDERKSQNLNTFSLKVANNKKLKKMKEIALTTSLINLFISLILWYQFDSNTTQFQFVSEFNQLNYFHLNFGIDGISIYFVLLTTFITPIAIFSNYSNITKNLKFFLISMLILESLQICAFVSLDLLLFYIFFESAKWFGKSLLCLQLSNSGDSLKLIIPNYNRKIISGWSNYSGKVTSYKMNENKMGYRGSKSDYTDLTTVKIISVKEQRVDGSWYIKRNYSSMYLRYTLMGFERNYQVSIPSNQIFIQTSTVQQVNPRLKRCFHTQSKKLILVSDTQIFLPLPTNGDVIESLQKLDPWFVTGFIDAEGFFWLYTYSNTASKSGWYVFLDFKITLHKKDRDLLDQIKNFFGVGEISKHGEKTINYGVRSIKDLQLIIKHFDKFTLKTKKLNDYKLFKLAFDIIKNKEHLTKDGFNKLLSIKSLMNKGLSPKLKLAFPEINISTVIIDSDSHSNEKFEPNWFAGFVSGDGSFQVDIRKSQTTKHRSQVLLRFSIGQHSRDEQLLIKFIDYLECGKVQKKIYKKNNKEFFEFRVEKFEDINKKIIPFFFIYPIAGQKLLDFQDFFKVGNLMEQKKHLTIEVLNQIRLIKKGLNRSRENPT
jgi:hypothetical protein